MAKQPKKKTIKASKGAELKLETKKELKRKQPTAGQMYGSKPFKSVEEQREAKKKFGNNALGLYKDHTSSVEGRPRVNKKVGRAFDSSIAGKKKKSK